MAWLHPPKDKQSLTDVAKLAAALRAGVVPARLLDAGCREVPLGVVARVLLMAPSELGLPPSARRFALARGTRRLCLAEIVSGLAGEAEARAHLDAVERQRSRSEGKDVIGWLIAERFSGEARALLEAGGAVASTTGATVGD